MGAPAGKAARARLGAAVKPVSTTATPSPRALERANPNASFKRGAARPMAPGQRSTQPLTVAPAFKPTAPTAQRPMPAARSAPAQQRSFLPKPPAKASKPVLRR